MPPETKIALEIRLAHQPRKETDSVPSPLGDGQTDTPIAHTHQGEVPTVPPKNRHHRGEVGDSFPSSL